MSLLFDQNLSRRLVAQLAAEYPGSQHVVTVGLADQADRAVWAYAVLNGLAIVSKDEDFSLLSGSLGFPPKVIWLQIGNGPTRDVENLLRSRRPDVMAFLADPSRGLLTLP